jgi:hypothetical protein
VSFIKPFEATAVKKDGKIRLRNQKAFQEWAERAREGQEFFVTFEKAHAIRSLDSNALYWAGYVNPVAEYTGYTAKQIHALFKKMFLPRQRIEIVNQRTGVVFETDLEQLSTTQLNKVEFSDYLTEIKDWVEATFHGAVTVGSNREAA